MGIVPALAAALLSVVPQEPARPVPELSRAIDALIREEFHRSPRAVVAPVADDGEFLRRLMLDLVGYPPDERELAAFLADRAPDKRLRAIDAFLASEGFAEFWSRRFALDLLEAPPSADALDRFAAWFRDQLRKDRPYDEIVRDVIGASGKGADRPELAYALSVNPKDAFPAAFAEGVSRHFLGVDLYCARCHDHAFDRWNVEQYYGMAGFVIRLKRGAAGLAEGEEDWSWGYPPSRQPPRFLLGGGPAEGEHPLQALARLTTSRENPRFSSAAVNRIWGWLSDRAIVEPPHRMDLANRPVARKLVGRLAAGFDAGGRSIRSVVRAICASDTYQRGCAHDGAPPRYDFTRMRVRPLTREQLVASVLRVTRGKADPAEVLDAARTMGDPVLFLRGGERVREGIRAGAVLRELRGAEEDVESKVDRLFRIVLSRPPAEAERRRFAEALRSRGDAGFEDAAWALLNTDEFRSRH
jgi:hypothetical protein